MLEKKLVLAVDDPRLFAKVKNQNQNGAVVEFFNSVAERRVLHQEAGSFAHAVLLPQTRVFHELDNGHWQVGRVIGKLEQPDGSFVYDVQFPNRQTVELHEDHLFVRCLDAFPDPADMLVSGCMEPQFFADRRRRALRRLRALRSAARGLTGLVSAGVEIVPHQVAAIRRVLQDPSLRYLLADEVGLGKTIEAGAIIRQVLIDDPSRTVAILVPRSILNQWRTELSHRFAIADFPEAVAILAYDQVQDLDPRSPPDLLVIDEAHRVVATPKEIATAPIVRQISELAGATPRLLLLSATPVLGDEDRLLGLLNLLDPANYPLQESEVFRRKVAERQAIGRLLLPLRVGANPFVLRQQAQLAQRAFPMDSTVLQEAERILGAGNDRSTLDAAVESLRDHIVRTYRIHQRIIRARRIDAEGWTMRPRGPQELLSGMRNLSHVRLEFDSDDRVAHVKVALEAWRISAQSVAAGARKAAVRRWRNMLEAASQGPAAFASLLRFFDDELFPGERAHLTELLEVAVAQRSGMSRYDAACAALFDWRSKEPKSLSKALPRKIICFATHPTDAQALYDHLSRAIGPGYVRATFDRTRSDDAAGVAARFAGDGQAWILVCDKVDEEGLNLQFAHAMLHMDLPFAPARLEQRIGRLDRFGRRIDKITHRLLLLDEDEESPWRAWFDLLANGFGIFNQSISDVQFRVEVIEQEISEALFVEGAAGLAAKTDMIVAALEDERRRLDEQHALEDLAQLSESAGDLVRGIEETEEDESALAADITPWVCDVLGLSAYPSSPNEGQFLRFAWHKDTLLPQLPWHSILKPGLDRPSTWNRQQAQTFVGRDLALLRSGSLLVEGLERIARWDDRGIAYATWRVVPGWPGMWRGFRLVWTVAAEIQGSGPIWAEDLGTELRRRAADFFPSLTVEHLLDEHGEPVKDPELRALLDGPYRDEPNTSGYQDFNLGSRPFAFAQAIDPGLFGTMISRVRESGAKALLDHPDLVARRESARKVYAREALRSKRSLEQRNILHRSVHGNDLPEFESEREALALLGKAIHEPVMRLDEIGFFVVAGAAPLRRSAQ